MSVDAELARWLKEGALYTTSENAAVAASYGALAREAEIMSPLALKAGADAEAARQAAFLAGPLVEDEVPVDGLREDLIGQLVTVVAPQLGYQNGVVVFVLGFDEGEPGGAELTRMQVLRKLP